MSHRATRRCARRRASSVPLAGLLALAQVTAAAAGTLSDDIRIESAVLGYALQYRVYTPDAPPGRALPTLYVTDGAWYLEQGRMRELLDEMIAAGRIEPLVAVFVDARDPDRLRTNRRNDQLICKSDYARFFAAELVPAIDASHPTRRDRDSRTILGLSFGGLNAACFGLSIPEVFAGIAMQSPASGEMVRIVGDAYRKADRLPLRMFLSVGTRKDNTGDGLRFRRILEDKGYELTFRQVPFGHDWSNWGPLLPDVLETFFGARVEDAGAVSRAAGEAYRARDWGAYLRNLQVLDGLRPGHPRVLYNLAGAYALAGNGDRAIATLARVASMGVVFPAAEDRDFEAVRDDPRFGAVLEAFERNGRETGRAVVAFTLPDAMGAVPEGVALDHEGGRAWVGLVRDRAVWQVDADGPASKLRLPADTWSVTGLQYDPAGDMLWFCTVATPMMREKHEAAVGRSAVVAWSVAQSEVVARWDLDASDAPHWLGDLVLAPGGTVYATDSRTPAIYRIVPGRERIERWVTNDGFVSLQGLALSADGRRLYVADYARGIWSVDPATGAAALLPVPPEATVIGIDGLYVHEGDLVAIQNGTRPHRIVRIRLDAAGERVLGVETLEANRPQFDEPTLGVIRDGTLWFVATSQWGSFTDDGRLEDGAVEKPATVMKRTL